jgi:hypothetical protein
MRALVCCRFMASILAAARLAGEPMGKSEGLGVSMFNPFRSVSRNWVSLNACTKLLLGPSRVRAIHDLHKKAVLSKASRTARRLVIASVHGTDDYRCTPARFVLRSEQCSGHCPGFWRPYGKVFGTQSVRRLLRFSTELFHLLGTMLATRPRRRTLPVPRGSFCQMPRASWSAQPPHFGATCPRRGRPTLEPRECLHRAP